MSGCVSPTASISASADVSPPRSVQVASVDTATFAITPHTQQVHMDSPDGSHMQAPPFQNSSYMTTQPVHPRGPCTAAAASSSDVDVSLFQATSCLVEALRNGCQAQLTSPVCQTSAAKMGCSHVGGDGGFSPGGSTPASTSTSSCVRSCNLQGCAKGLPPGGVPRNKATRTGSRDGDQARGQQLCVICMDAQAVIGFRHGHTVHCCACHACAAQVLLRAGAVTGEFGTDSGLTCQAPCVVLCPVCRQGVSDLLLVH